MKKRSIVTMFTVAALSATLLVGCGGSDNNENTTAKNEASDNQGSDKTTEPKGYVFESKGVKIGVDMEAAPIVEALGEPSSYFEAASCAFEGLDKMYTYGSFEIDTYEQDGKDYVSQVVFKDDMVQTPEGIAIGMSKAKLTSVYGEDYTEEQGMLVYANDGMKLKFIVDGEDSITSIVYASTILETN